MEWSKDQIRTLISQYEQRSCLWDVMSKDYKNRTKKKDAWNEIAAYMGLDTEAVDKKMKCILVQYRRERKKVADAMSSGAEDIKTPKWFAFENLQFLDGICKARKAAESLGGKLLHEEPEEDSIHESDHEEATLLLQHSHQSPDFLYRNIDQDRTFKLPEKLSTSTKRKKVRYDKRMDQACSVMESVVQMKKHRASRDEFTAYGEVVGMKIRNLPTQFERSLTQHKINTLLFEAEMGRFRHPDSQFLSQVQSPLEFSSDSTDYSVTPSPSSINSPICSIVINDIPTPINDL